MRAPYYRLETLEPNTSIGFLVKHCGVLMTQVATRRFESLPITFMQWLVLMHVGQQAHVSATQLSAHLGHDMGALTRVVDELVRRGLVRRERSSSDRSAVEIAITAAGRRQTQLGKREVVELLNRLIEPFTDKEVDMLIALLQRLTAYLATVEAQVAPAAGATRRAPRRPARRTTPGGKA